MNHILLLTPLQDELDALSASLAAEGLSIEETACGAIAGRRVPQLGLTMAVCGHGKAQAALQTQHLIHHLSDLKCVICCGTSGSLSPQVRVGDLIAATETVEHDFRNRFVQRPDPRFSSDPQTLASLRASVQRLTPDFTLHFGIVASGDEDVVTTERAEEIARQTAGLCVAWEGAGVARACRFSAVPFLELRCITDFADKEAPTHFDLNLARAMHNAAWLLNRWLNDGAYLQGLPARTRET